ncbi:TPA: hypothetical protein EYP13_05255 [Candidatus Micrarchaeota archaeon]|nr:hypothetical protein [Candidatus Micrarchaeota archaeon]
MRIAIDPLDAYPLDTAMNLAEENGLMVEVQMEPPTFSWDAGFLKTLEDVAGTFGLILHAPYREVFLASVHPVVQRASVQLVKDSVDLAARTGAEVLVMHLGSFNRKQERDDVLDRIVPPLREILDYAEERGVVVAVENVAFGPVGVLPSDFFYLFEKVGAFPLCLDVAHAYSTGSLDAFLDLFSDVPVYHLSDTVQGKDLHAEIGSGEIPWKSVLERMNKNAVVVLEVGGFTPALRSLERLRRMISELDDGQLQGYV